MRTVTVIITSTLTRGAEQCRGGVQSSIAVDEGALTMRAKRIPAERVVMTPAGCGEPVAEEAKRGNDFFVITTSIHPSSVVVTAPTRGDGSVRFVNLATIVVSLRSVHVVIHDGITAWQVQTRIQ